MAEQVAPGAPLEARGLFVRQSSGLIREFRPADVFVFNTPGTRWASCSWSCRRSSPDSGRSRTCSSSS